VLFALLYLVLRRLIGWAVGSPAAERSKDIEILVLHHQLEVLHRQMPGRDCGAAIVFSWPPPVGFFPENLGMRFWSPRPLSCTGSENSCAASGPFGVIPAAAVPRWKRESASCCCAWPERTRDGAAGASRASSTSWASECRRPRSAAFCVAMDWGPHRVARGQPGLSSSEPRPVASSPLTASRWVTQQARNLSGDLADEGRAFRFLLEGSGLHVRRQLRSGVHRGGD
jgi:hypothetical protein